MTIFDNVAYLIYLLFCGLTLFPLSIELVAMESLKSPLEISLILVLSNTVD